MKSIGSVKENLDTEKRISITLETAKKLIDLQFNIFIEKGYGEHLGIDVWTNINDKYDRSGVAKLNDWAQANNTYTQDLGGPNESTYDLEATSFELFKISTPFSIYC